MVFMTDDDAESDANDDARFQLAAHSAGRIVKLWRAHAYLPAKALSQHTGSNPARVALS